MRTIILFLSLAWLGISTSVGAQITVTNATFPAVNDTIFYAVDANSNVIQIVFTPPGGNQNWDLSGLQTGQTGSTVYRNPNAGAQSASFPGAELRTVEPGKESYYDVTNNTVALLGYYGSDPIGLGINLLMPYTPPLVERRAPMNFFDIHQASSGVLVPFDDSQVPANLLQLFPAQADSFRIRIAVNRLDVVDAWGTLSIPGGCYPVLREKRTQYEEKRLDAKVPPLGWLDVTDIAIQTWGLQQLGVDTIVQFHYFSTVDKQEIAVVRLNTAQNAVEMVRFKHPDNSQFSISNIVTTPESCPNTNDGSITITATASAGALTYSISGPANQSNGTGIFTGLPGGNYNITVTSNASPCPATSTATVVAGVDTTPPTAVCSNPTVVFNGQNSVLLDANDFVQAGDNCGVASIVLSPSSISFDQVGQTVPVSVTVTDLSGNTATCMSNVGVSGLPAGWSQQPGGVNCAGGNNIAFNPANGVWTAAGTNCYYDSPFTSDSHAFAQRTLCGDGSITAQVTNISGSAFGWAGVIMRESNAAGAKKMQLTTNLSNFSQREVRTTTGGQAFPQQLLSYNRYWLRISRTGNQFTMYVSANGQAWFFAGVQIIQMAQCIQMGLVGTNYGSNSTVTSTFANVSATGSATPPPASGGSPAALSEMEHPMHFSLFPNPSSGEVTLDLAQYAGKPVRMELYNLQGQLLYFREVDEVQNATERLDLSAYKAGMYLVRVHCEGTLDSTQRVVLMR